MVAFPFLELFIYMKSAFYYINESIKREIIKLLNEEDAIGVNPVKDAENQIKFDQDQSDTIKSDIKKLKNWEVQAQSDIKGLLQQQRLTKDPIQKSISNLSLSKVATPRDRDLKAMIAKKQQDLQDLDDKIKADNLKLTSAKKGISLNASNQSSEGEGENVSESIKEKKSLPMITRTFAEQNELPAIDTVNNQPSNKAYLVKFDKNTQRPFDVKFTERGFSIEGTRLSFEALEIALSKNYTITLNNGKGLMLDAIRMQKILKY